MTDPSASASDDQPSWGAPPDPPPPPPQPGTFQPPPPSQPQQPYQPPPPGQFQPPQPYQPTQPYQPYQPTQPGPGFYEAPAQPFVPGGYQEGWVPELGVQIGSVGARIGAKAIDIAIYLVISVGLGLAAALVLLGSDPTFGTSSSFDVGANLAAGLVIGVVLILVDFLYNVVCTARFGGTPGKLMVGLRVIPTNGRPIDLRVAFMRWSPILAILILGLIPLISILGSLARFVLLIANLIMVLTDERRRDVFDRVASTYVIVKP